MLYANRFQVQSFLIRHETIKDGKINILCYYCLVIIYYLQIFQKYKSFEA